MGFPNLVAIAVISSFTASVFKSAFVLTFCHRDQYPHPCSKWYAPVSCGREPLLWSSPKRLCSSVVFPFCPLFPEARYVCVRSGLLLLLAFPMLFQRYLRCRPWSLMPFENYSISVLRGHTINAISRYRSVGHDCT